MQALDDSVTVVTGRRSRRLLLEQLTAACADASGVDIEATHGPSVYLLLTRLMAWLRAAVATEIDAGRITRHGSEVARLLNAVLAMVRRPTGTAFLAHVADAGGVACVVRLVAAGHRVGPGVSLLAAQLARAIARGGRVYKERLCRGGVVPAVAAALRAVPPGAAGGACDGYRALLVELSCGNTTCEADVMDAICDAMEQ